MTNPIWNYSGNQKSLRSDALFLVHLRALNVAAGDRAISADQPTLAKTMVFPAPGVSHLSERTNRAALRRLIDSVLVFVKLGKGRAANVYYVPPCSLERIRYALRFGLSDKNMYAPHDSPVCMTWRQNCQCLESLAATEQGRSVMICNPPPRAIRAIHISHWRITDFWKRGQYVPSEIFAAQYFINQLQQLASFVQPLDVWAIPSVKHILLELERFKAFER